MIVRLLKDYFGLATGIEVSVDATTANWMFLQGIASIQDYNDGVKKVSVELTRPADTTTYDAGDAILGATTAVKQKETLTLAGAFGTAVVTAAGGLTRTATFTTTPIATATAFAAANVAAYLAQGIVLTSSDADLIFEAQVVGVPFTPPVITYATSSLTGTVAHVTANTTAVKQKETVFLLGETGTSVITVAGGLTKTVTFHTDLDTTASDFVTAFAADYLVQHIVLTASTSDLVFEAQTAGTAFAAPLISGVVGDLAGIVSHSTANRAAVKQKDTLSLTGASGTAVLTGITINPKTITYSVSPTQTATNFTAANVAEYLTHGIVLTSSSADLIFEAQVAGVSFTHPVLTFTASTLGGLVVNTLAAGVADKQKDTLTLSGTAGRAVVALAGGLTLPITFSNNLTETAANFVTDNAASYLDNLIVLTSSSTDLIFEATEVITAFTSPTITTSLNIQGSWVATTANVTAVAQVETTAVAGVSGYALIDVAGGLSKYLAFTTGVAAGIDAFITANAALYTAQGITLSRDNANLVMTAAAAGTGFTAPTIANTPGLRGTVAHTTANRAAVKQVETITNAGAFGEAAVAVAGGITAVSAFHTDATTTWSDFVTANAAAYDAQGIVLTSTPIAYNALGITTPTTTAVLTMTAKVAGTGFTAPTITTRANLSGTVVPTTANVSLSALQFVGASKQSGIGSQLIMVKAATNMTMFSGKTIRLWFFSSAPTLILGDNVAYLNKYANAEASDFYVDIVFDTTLSGSDMVYGKALPIVPMPFGAAATTLYCLIQSIDGATTPTTGGKLRLNAYFK